MLHPRRATVNDIGNGSNHATMSLDEANDIVQQFQIAMAVANHHILENPQRNNYTVADAPSLAEKKETASPLPYGISNTTTSIASRDSSNSLYTNGTFGGSSYTIPPEVVEASRLVAEAADTSNELAEDYSSLFHSLKVKHNLLQNDTNVMPQTLKRPSGLVEVVPTDQIPILAQNDTTLVDTSQVGAWDTV
jgi:hypothetical protein